jgi:Uma2 family endonuclease
MAINTQQPYMTLDDLLAKGEDASFEIIEGDVIEMPPAGGLHQIVAGNIIRILSAYVHMKRAGYILPDQMTYLMHSDSKGLKNSLVPDVSFLSRENIPSDWDIEKPHPGVPDLAIEIVSPGNDAHLILQKTTTYLEKGTTEVWLVYPRLKELHQYKASQPDNVRRYHEGKIDADDLFPGIDGLTIEAIFEILDSSEPTDNDNDKDNS